MYVLLIIVAVFNKWVTAFLPAPARGWVPGGLDARVSLCTGHGANEHVGMGMCVCTHAHAHTCLNTSCCQSPLTFLERESLLYTARRFTIDIWQHQIIKYLHSWKELVHWAKTKEMEGPAFTPSDWGGRSRDTSPMERDHNAPSTGRALCLSPYSVLSLLPRDHQCSFSLPDI